MKALLQLLGILLIMAVVGTVYNLWNSGDTATYLPWVSSVYVDAREVPVISEPRPSPEARPSPEPTSSPAPTSSPEPVTSSGSAPASDSRFPMIGTEETLEELEAESLIVDARRTKVYREGHIPGAISMSPWEADLPEKIAKLVDGGAILEAPVVVYCNDSKECEDSKMVAHQLEAAGFLDLKIYQGGFPSWKKENPDLVVKGSEPGELP